MNAFISPAFATFCFTLISSQVFLTGASGVFEIRIEEFVNEAGRDRHGGCCSGNVLAESEACSEPCKTSFHVCLTHFQWKVGSGRVCTFGSADTPVLGKNTITARHFDPAGVNPIQLDFNFTWPGSFSLIIEATHRQKRNLTGTIIARMQKRGSINANTDWATETQTQQEKILRYSYRVRCKKHYYGSGCSKYCRPRDDLFGHWTCNKKGEKNCLPGWTSRERSDKTYCLEPVCRLGCNTTHGYCTRPDECICRHGWQGELCDQCTTYPGCLHGTCYESFECNCDPGWGGMFCNHDLNYCTHHKPCKNGARCINVGQGSFTCECSPGFTDRMCGTKISECDPNPCENDGKCKVQEAGYMCDCQEHFFGTTCENTDVTCELEPCQNGGNCFQEASRYRCGCKSGFRGVNCEMVDPSCSSITCLNGGTCRNGKAGLNCLCAVGFSGDRCHLVVTTCDMTMCQNGGKCILKNQKPRCECAEGFRGQRCQYRAQPCSGKPCRNGGLCKPYFSDYKCTCSRGYIGRQCDMRPCANKPCANGSQSSKNPHHDQKGTQIILLTKNERSGLSTAQWMTVCFSSAFLLIVLIAVAVCVTYQNHRKPTYSEGRAVKNLIARPLESIKDTTFRAGSSQTVESSVSHNSQSFPDCNVLYVPTQTSAIALHCCPNSKDLKLDSQECQEKERQLIAHYPRPRAHAYSLSDIRYKSITDEARDNPAMKGRVRSRSTIADNGLPSYREACDER